ncbi:MAG: ACT domain-containing protein [Clostridia bacterium]|nr:ACT domain-containing protein [Clostridia bacterium]
MKAVVTVVGKDRTGIIARVSGYLAEKEINILDISQTIMQDLFTMIMLVDTVASDITAEALAKDLKSIGEELGTQINVQHEGLFSSMHRI